MRWMPSPWSAPSFWYASTKALCLRCSEPLPSLRPRATRSSRTSRRGIRAGHVGMVIAFAGTLLLHAIVAYRRIAIALVLGSILGVPLVMVHMTAVPPFFFFNDPAPPDFYPLPLPAAFPI